MILLLSYPQGDIYWSLMLFGILGNFLMSVPVDKNVKAGPSVGWLLFQLGTLPLLNCIFRLAYYTLPNIPSDQTDAFVAMFAAWYDETPHNDCWFFYR